MKVLIAGGAGYVGSVLTPKLKARGYDISVVDLLWFDKQLDDDIPVIQKNIFDLREDDLKGFDQVIFLAGLSNDPMAEYSPGRNFVENGSAPSYLAYIAKNAGVKRFIYGGSCSVYGYTVNELYDEEQPAVSGFPYAISKRQGEFGSLQLQDDDFSVICFRKGTICGYSPRMRLDLVINTMFKTAMSENKIIVNNPAIWRPILSITDAATAYTRAIEAPPSISGIFNIASGNYTIGEIADHVKEGIEECLSLKPKVEINHNQDYRNYKVSTQKARDVLSFKAEHNVKSIVKNLIDHRELFSDFSDPKYYNIEVFKKFEDR